MENALFFENDGYQLFGILHTPQNDRNNSRKGIVFCHPYGEEKQMSYRVFVRFARELCDLGFHVLRFDARGYGDSEGDFEEATVDTQIADTIKAMDFLDSELKNHKTNLLGFRLGATVAALTAEKDPRVERLILWNPIVEGKRFLDELFRKKMFGDLGSEAGAMSKSEMVLKLRQEGLFEVEAHNLTLELYEQLMDVDLRTQVLNFNKSVFISTGRNGKPEQNLPFEELSTVYEKLGAASDFEIVDDKDFCNKQALFGWYFPLQLFRATKEWLAASPELN